MADLRVNFCGVELKNPITTASGTFGFGHEYGEFFDPVSYTHLDVYKRQVSLGVLGVSCFWSIKELKEQEKRVAKGWFPKRKVDKH